MTNRMTNNIDKPSAEARALSLFLMAHKSKKPIYKEQSKRINRLWGLVSKGEFSSVEYLEEVQRILALNGGYEVVVEKTVKFYIQKTGAWTLEGDDQYCQDAKAVAEKILNK